MVEAGLNAIWRPVGWQHWLACEFVLPRVDGGEHPGRSQQLSAVLQYICPLLVSTEGEGDVQQDREVSLRDACREQDM